MSGIILSKNLLSDFPGREAVFRIRTLSLLSVISSLAHLLPLRVPESTLVLGDHLILIGYFLFKYLARLLIVRV